MASQAQANTATAEIRIVPVPAMAQIQALLDAVTPEQLAGPIPGAKDPDDSCLILGGLTEDMLRLYYAGMQLKPAQDADIAELEMLAASGDAGEEQISRHASLVAALDSRKLLHSFLGQMFWFDVREMFPALKNSGCPGHIFSDGTVGLHENHGGISVVMISMHDLFGGGIGLRGH